MIWTLKKIFALLLAKLLTTTLPACLPKFNFFFAGNGRSLRFHDDKFSFGDLLQLS